MNKIETGYIASVHTPFELFKPLRWIASLIRFFTKSYWNHSMLFYKDGDKIFAVESDIGGVVKTPIEDMNMKKTIKIYKMPHPDEHRLLEKVGIIKYDFASLILHQLPKIYLGIWIGPRSEEKRYIRMTCSEFVGWYLRLRRAFKITPKKLDKYLSKRYEVVYEGTVKNLLENG